MVPQVLKSDLDSTSGNTVALGGQDEEASELLQEDAQLDPPKETQQANTDADAFIQGLEDRSKMFNRTETSEEVNVTRPVMGHIPADQSPKVNFEMQTQPAPSGSPSMLESGDSS